MLFLLTCGENNRIPLKAGHHRPNSETPFEFIKRVEENIPNAGITEYLIAFLQQILINSVIQEHVEYNC